jgi:tetratricopeptide (TPR) repeat protein
MMSNGFSSRVLYTLLVSSLAVMPALLSGCGLESMPEHPAPAETVVSKPEEGSALMPPSQMKEASTLNEAAADQLKAGHTDEALESLEKAQDLAPKHLPIQENMARALEADDQWPQARDRYEALARRGELSKQRRSQYLLRAVDLNIKLAEAGDKTHRWDEAKTAKVVGELSQAVDEDTYVDRVDILRGYYNLDPQG